MEFDGALSDLSGFLLIDEPAGAALRRILDATLRCLPPCDGAGITTVHDGGVRAAVSNNDLTATLDALQHRTGEGPCAEALRTARPQQIDSTRRDPRWPPFTHLAVTQGILSCLALPLRVRERPVAVLCLYSRSLRAFGALEPAVTDAVGSLAGMALANLVAYHARRTAAGDLSEFLRTSDDVIAQAQGLLMERDGRGAEGALARLHEESKRDGHTVEEASRAVIASTRGEGSPAPGPGA